MSSLFIKMVKINYILAITFSVTSFNIFVMTSSFVINFSNNENLCPDFHYYNATDGDFQSPNFPDNYPNNISCNFIIVAPQDKRVEVTADFFETEVCCDHLSIYDGMVDDQSTLIYQMSGEATGTVVTTYETNIMVLKFGSDQNRNFPGFNFTFTAINASQAIRPPTTTTTTTLTTTTTTVLTTTSLSILSSILTTLSSSSSTTMLLQNSKSYIWWVVTGTTLIFLIFCGIIVKIIIAKKARNQRMTFQNAIIQKAGKNNFNRELPAVEQNWKMFLDTKNLIIDFDNILGKGSNATVYKAIQKDSHHFPVMRKTFKSRHFNNLNGAAVAAAKIPTNYNANDAEEFIREINSLIFLRGHNNIILFIGWTMLSKIPVLITELADTTLLTFVKGFENSQSNFLKPVLQILWQTSNALEYLTEKKMIHRDVACRNILLTCSNNNIIAKLSDFGLCCKIDAKYEVYKDSFSKRFPIKWLSIEALNECIFSEKSDVWAFGILCFEVFSYGAIPYASMLHSEMIEFLNNGKRLEKPADAPEYIYQLMINSWEAEPCNRSTFKEISKGIRVMLENETVKYGYLSLDGVIEN